MAWAAPCASKKFTLLGVNTMLAGIVATDAAAVPTARFATAAVTGLAVVPSMTRLPLVSTELGKPFVVSEVARIERVCAGVLTVLSKGTRTWPAPAVAGTPALVSLITKVVVTPPWVTSNVSPLVIVGAVGAVEKVSVWPTVIGVVLPVFRFCAGVVGRFAE